MIEDRAAVKAQWNEQAAQWATSRHPYYGFRDDVAGSLLERRGISPRVLLDIGCASGHFSHLMQGRGWDVYGTDIAENMVRRAAELCNAPERFVQDDSTGDPFPGMRFDVVAALGVFPFWADHPRKIRWLAGLLKPGGYVLTTCTIAKSLHTYYAIRSELLEKRPVDFGTIRKLWRTGLWSGGHSSGRKFTTTRAFDRGFRRAGFTLVDSADLYALPGRDDNALYRAGIGRFAARMLAWEHVGLYRLD